MKPLQKIARFFLPWTALDYLYPRNCVLCGVEGVEGVCEECALSFVQVELPYCIKCGKPLRQAFSEDSCAECYGKWKHIDRARSLFIYKAPASVVLHRFKYQRRIGLGGFFGKFLAEIFPSVSALSALFGWELEEVPILIVPVPIHPVKKFTRGFNQNEVVLQFYAPVVGIPVSNLMTRRKFTRSQVGLTEQKRFQNVKRAFFVPRKLSEQIEGKSVLLFDDLITTGATINSAAYALKEAGAKHVFALSLFTAVKE